MRSTGGWLPWYAGSGGAALGVLCDLVHRARAATLRQGGSSHAGAKSTRNGGPATCSCAGTGGSAIVAALAVSCAVVSWATLRCCCGAGTMASGSYWHGSCLGVRAAAGCKVGSAATWLAFAAGMGVAAPLALHGLLAVVPRTLTIGEAVLAAHGTVFATAGSVCAVRHVPAFVTQVVSAAARQRPALMGAIVAGTGQTNAAADMPGSSAGVGILDPADLGATAAGVYPFICLVVAGALAGGFAAWAWCAARRHGTISSKALAAAAALAVAAVSGLLLLLAAWTLLVLVPAGVGRGSLVAYWAVCLVTALPILQLALAHNPLPKVWGMLEPTGRAGRVVGEALCLTPLHTSQYPSQGASKEWSPLAAVPHACPALHIPMCCARLAAWVCARKHPSCGIWRGAMCPQQWPLARPCARLFPVTDCCAQGVPRAGAPPVPSGRARRPTILGGLECHRVCSAGSGGGGALRACAVAGPSGAPLHAGVYRARAISNFGAQRVGPVFVHSCYGSLALRAKVFCHTHCNAVNTNTCRLYACTALFVNFSICCPP